MAKGRVNILIANAGIGREKTIEESNFGKTKILRQG
jgi:hypothetical protein